MPGFVPGIHAKGNACAQFVDAHGSSPWAQGPRDEPGHDDWVNRSSESEVAARPRPLLRSLVPQNKVAGGRFSVTLIKAALRAEAVEPDHRSDGRPPHRYIGKNFVSRSEFTDEFSAN